MMQVTLQAINLGVVSLTMRENCVCDSCVKGGQEYILGEHHRSEGPPKERAIPTTTERFIEQVGAESV